MRLGFGCLRGTPPSPVNLLVTVSSIGSEARRSWLCLWIFRFLEYGLYDSPARDVRLAFLATSELLHYYYGGFFWKIRDTDTSYGRGLSNARCSSSPACRYVGDWPDTGRLLTLVEVYSSLNLAQRSVNLSLPLPSSHSAQLEAGQNLTANDRLTGSALKFQRALEI